MGNGRVEAGTITADPAVPGAPTGPAGAAATGTATDDGDGLVEEELLVEEISIDGMCGVY